jgi:hypothetical protein
MPTITVLHTSIDGARQRRSFTSIEKARKFAHDWVGPHPEIGRTYAISGDGVGRIEVTGASLGDLFPPPAPHQAAIGDHPNKQAQFCGANHAFTC